MGKNQSASNLINIINYNNGNILFVSGSTTLMTISSSGEIITTGVISGSNILTSSYSQNSELLDNFDATSFVFTSSYNTDSSSFSTRVTNNESTGSSLTTASGSFSTRVSTIESKYATTGSNTFTGPQYVSHASNAIGFTSTASLYTDGGFRVTKDAFVSGTLYLNNLTVYGTSSIQYITSSQLNVATNIITVNTDTPAVRFGGLTVYDSGSLAGTGSLFWDSEQNHWVYANPSGSSYSGGMLMSGPRSQALGSEQGTTACALMMGQGGDHITSSAIFHYGNATCFYGQSYISSSGLACFSGTVCAPVHVGGTFTGTTVYGSTAICGGAVSGTTGTFSGQIVQTLGNNQILFDNSSATTGYQYMRLVNSGSQLTWGIEASISAGLFNNTSAYAAVIGNSKNAPFEIGTNATVRLSIASTGAACFACELTAKTIGTNDLILNNLNHEHANYVDGTRGSWLIQEGACDLFIINQVTCKKYKFNLIEIK